MAKQKMKFKKVVKTDTCVENYAMPQPEKVSIRSILFHPFLCLGYGILCIALYPLYLAIVLATYISSRKVTYEEV